MVGFRKESFYIEKYGEEIGKQKYQKVVDHRLVRETRRSISNDTIECCLCHKQMKRITKTHLKSGCVESITPEEYKNRFPNAPIMVDSLKKLFSNTEQSIKEKYGEDDGDKRWKNYQKVQAETNTFEYKAKKYNISKQEFDEYNKSRSSTLENFIERYGEEVGLDKWDEYCERQRYTTTLEYFIEKYGEVEGQERFDRFCLGRNLTYKKQSNLEVIAYEEIKNILPLIEMSIRLENPYYGPYDFGNIHKKKLIEFYGTYWHTDPRFYVDEYIRKQGNLTAKKIRERDQAKRTYAENNGYSVFIIWEYDWKNNKEIVIENLKRWWNEK